MTTSATALSELFSLRGRVAAVTGGGGPLGSLLAQTLGALGAKVLVLDLDAGSTSDIVERLRKHDSVDCEGLAVDLSTEVGTASASEWISSFGQLDVLVHNAALTGTSETTGYVVPFGQQTSDAFRRAVDINLVAPFALTQSLVPLLSRGGHSSVICVSSIYGSVGPNMNLYAGTEMGNPAAYAASKGGLVQLTRYLSTVLAPAVRVNAFAPGGIERGQPTEFVERYTRLTPLARMATEDDFCGVLAFLASDASRYVTGQVINVDGGWTAW